MVQVKDRFIDEKTKIEYVKCGDYYLPNLKLSIEDTNYSIGKYGRMKLNYLKNNKKAEYSILLIDGKLNRYLYEIDIAVTSRVKAIISQLIKKENVTEELKINNQLEWAGKMNSIKNRAEIRLYEMYLNEAIEERKAGLINKNTEYQKLREKFNDIMNEYPNLQLIFEENRQMILDETECKMLQKLVAIYMDICDLEEKEIFLLGGKEMFYYLKDTGVIKEK